MLLNNQWITEEIKEEIKKYLEANTTIQNVWDTAKAFLTEKFIAIQSNLRKHEKSQMNDINLTPKTTREKITNKTQS